jgi:hypothetical protein
VLAAGAAPAHAEDAGRVAIVDYGIYAHRVMRYESAPRQVSGERVIVSNVVLLRKADVVNAQPGLMIGLQFRVTDPRLVGKTLTIRRIVPPLTNPTTGQTSTVIARDVVIADTSQLYLNAYRFDYGWEMAEGLWRFQVVYDGRVLAEKTIRVVVAMN